MSPVRWSRLPDSIAPEGQKRPAKKKKLRRSAAEMRADLERSLLKATSPLEIRLKRRALAQMDRDQLVEPQKTRARESGEAPAS